MSFRPLFQNVACHLEWQALLKNKICKRNFSKFSGSNLGGIKAKSLSENNEVNSQL